MTDPRGIRNNNPGNIRHSTTTWEGEAAQQPDPKFVAFAGPQWGLRAIGKILLTYQGDGVHSVRQIITRWAPAVENDTEAYVHAVSREVGVDPDTPIDVTNPGLAASLVKAIVRHENGEQPYPDDLVKRALAMAGIGGAA